MSSAETPILPNLEYIKFIEPHLATKIVEFLLKINPSDEIKTLYKNIILFYYFYAKKIL